METIFIKSPGKIKVSQGTLVYEDLNKNKKVIPIKQIKQVFVFTKSSLTSGAIRLLLLNNVYVHFYSSKGNYLGSLVPKKFHGKVVIKQIEKHKNYGDRLYISREIIEACKHNFYELFRRKLPEEAKEFKNISTAYANSIEEIMGIESQIFILAYKLYDKLSPKYKIVERTRRPPLNEANAVLSFLNSILYGMILTEIYRNMLLPSISFLHEAREDRPSLSLDIAEIFKPIFSFRLMLRLFNLGKLKEEHFIKKDGVYLNDDGKYIVLREVNKILDKKIRIYGLGKRRLKHLFYWQVKKLREFIEDKEFSLKTVKVY